MATQRKPPPCSQEELRDLLEYTEDGNLWWNYTGTGRNIDLPAGTINRVTGYRAIMVKGTLYLAHRVVYYWHTGEWPDVIDHINGDRADNRIENLRSVSQLANLHGVRRDRQRKGEGLPGTRYKGRIKRWVALITVRGEVRYLGCYKTTEAAHEAYLAAKEQLRQELGTA